MLAQGPCSFEGGEIGSCANSLRGFLPTSDGEAAGAPERKRGQVDRNGPITDDKVVAARWMGATDEEGFPVANESYVITMADNSEKTGSTDDDGCARFDGIIPGQCKVCFPNLDQDVWSKIA